MASLEEKILNGPKIQYCDDGDEDIRSGNEIDENHINNDNKIDNLFRRTTDEEKLSSINPRNWRGDRGCSSNTGPKGVIGDFNKRRFQSESANSPQPQVDDLDVEFQMLMNDNSILEEYISKRMSESTGPSTPMFGQVQRLRSGDQLLDAIDKENPNVTVVVHLFAKYSKSCENMNRCLEKLAKELKYVKFVALDTSVTGLSANFKDNGVPALLSYKGGDLVKSLVQLEDLLDKNFGSEQVKDLMLENGLLVSG